jgi:hypothetical protein
MGVVVRDLRSEYAARNLLQTRGAKAILEARRNPIHLLFGNADRSTPALIAAT